MVDVRPLPHVPVTRDPAVDDRPLHPLLRRPHAPAVPAAVITPLLVWPLRVDTAPEVNVVVD